MATYCFRCLVRVSFMFFCIVAASLSDQQLTTSPLPEVLRLANGTPVTTSADWFEKRRPEVLNLLREHVYGYSPAHPSVVTTALIDSVDTLMNGTAIRKRITIGFAGPRGSKTFTLLVFLPKTGTKPVPLFMLLNNRSASNIDPTRATISPFWPAEKVIERGYGIAALQLSEIAPDDKNTYISTGVISAYETAAERHANSWATIAAWAWGGSLAMDYFARDVQIDETRIAIVGHSRGGKAALWCGAEDTRFAMVVSNCSGCTGAALSRRTIGETVKDINTSFPHWFNTNYKQYNDREDLLPIDQHQLLALIAPRLLYVASAQADTWADPEGEYLSCYFSSPVYRLLGKTGMDTTAQPITSFVFSCQ